MMRWMGLGWLLVACDATPPEETKDTPVVDASTTYHAHVREVFDAKCVSCHQPGSVGPFSMVYDEAEWADGPPSWVPAALSAVEAGTMPPWLPDEDACTSFEDSMALTDAERQVLSDWKGLDFPVGDPASFQPPVSVPPVDPGPATVRLRAEAPYTPSPEYTDDYHCTPLTIPEEGDVWLRGIEVVPDVAEMVHHVILYKVEPGNAYRVQERDDAEPGPGYTCFGQTGAGYSETLMAWAPGQNREFLEEGLGRRVEEGAQLVLQVHYNALAIPKGEAVPPDNTAVDLWLHPKDDPPSEALLTIPFPNFDLFIEAGDDDSRHYDEVKLDFGIPAGLKIPVVGVTGHMHQLGKALRTEIVHADGSTSCALDIPRWSFDWQQTYWFADEPLSVSAGDTVSLECAYDNSAANQPSYQGTVQEPRDVTWGDGTFDEMCLAYYTVRLPAAFL